MIAFAALAGTMVATKTAPFHPAAAVPGEDAFPAALQGIAQAGMNARQPLALDAKATQSAASLSMGSSARSTTTPLGHVDAENKTVATSAESKGSPIASGATEENPLSANTRVHPAGGAAQPSPNATLHEQEMDAQETPGSSATSTLGATISTTAVTAAISVPQATAAALATEEDQASRPLKAADAEAARRTSAKPQVPASGDSHPAKADLHKVLAGGTPHTEGTTHPPAANAAAPSSAVLSGEHRETGQPMQSAPQVSGEQGSIVPPSISANVAATGTTQQHGHAAPAKAASTHASPVAGSNSDSQVADAAVSASGAASAAESVAKVQPDGGASFKAQASMASQEGGHVISAPAAMPPNPLSNSHSAGAASKAASLADTTAESSESGEASYSGALGRESHGTLVATPTTLEIGVPRGAEGWLKIRAEVGSDGISASLSTASHAGQSMLRDQLPAINAFLQGERIHASATVLDRGIQTSSGDGGSNAGMDRGLGQEGRAQSEQRQLSQTREEAPELAEDSHTLSPQAGVGVLLSGATRAGASLSVLA
jgi:hypothetical protein